MHTQNILPLLLQDIHKQARPLPDLKTISDPESLLDNAGVEPGGGGSMPELSQDSTAESTDGIAGPKRPIQSSRVSSSLGTPMQGWC